MLRCCSRLGNMCLRMGSDRKDRRGEGEKGNKGKKAGGMAPYRRLNRSGDPGRGEGERGRFLFFAVPHPWLRQFSRGGPPTRDEAAVTAWDGDTLQLA